MPEKKDWERIARLLELEMEWRGGWFGARGVKLHGRRRARPVSLSQRWDYGLETGARTVETPLSPPLDLGALVVPGEASRGKLVVDGLEVRADEPERAARLFTPALRARVALLQPSVVQLSFTDVAVHVARGVGYESVQEITGDFDLALDVAEAIDGARAELPVAEALAADERVLSDLAQRWPLTITSRCPLSVRGELDGARVFVDCWRAHAGVFRARFAAVVPPSTEPFTQNVETIAPHLIEPTLLHVVEEARKRSGSSTEGPYR